MKSNDAPQYRTTSITERGRKAVAAHQEVEEAIQRRYTVVEEQLNRHSQIYQNVLKKLNRGRADERVTVEELQSSLNLNSFYYHHSPAQKKKHRGWGFHEVRFVVDVNTEYVVINTPIVDCEEVEMIQYHIPIGDLSMNDREITARARREIRVVKRKHNTEKINTLVDLVEENRLLIAKKTLMEELDWTWKNNASVKVSLTP